MTTVPLSELRVSNIKHWHISEFVLSPGHMPLALHFPNQSCTLKSTGDLQYIYIYISVYIYVSDIYIYILAFSPKPRFWVNWSRVGQGSSASSHNSSRHCQQRIERLRSHVVQVALDLAIIIIISFHKQFKQKASVENFWCTLISLTVV